MKISTKQIALTALLLAVCIGSQFFKNASVYITGPIINAALIIAVIYCGLACGIILSVITPVTAFLITGSPIMTALPAMFPCIMAGNVVLVVTVFLLKKKLPLAVIAGAIVKAAVMGIAISLILLPNFLPEKMMPMLSALQLQFSVTQGVTALIGGVYALVINLVLKRERTGGLK